MLNLDEITVPPFEFQIHGKAYSVPAINGLEVEPVLDMIIDDKPMTRADLTELFRSVVRKYAPDALEGMTIEQFKRISTEYMNSGNAGESSPSSD